MSHFFSRYKVHVLFAAIVFAGLAFAFLVTGGYYPVALVNGSFVSARTVNREYAASDFYYHKMLETYGDKAFGTSTLAATDLEASAMEKIVEDILVEKAAQKEVGSALTDLVASKLSAVGSDTELQTAAGTLYGLDQNGFRDFVLVPQAERDILSGRLFLKGQKFDDWLVEAKQSANVSIFSSQFRWTSQGVATSTP